MLIGGEAYDPNKYVSAPNKPKTRVESFLFSEMGKYKVLSFRRNEIESEESIQSLGIREPTNYQTYEIVQIES